MMKFVLVLALAALALAGPTCTTLENANFDDPNTIAPWLSNAYLGGSEDCGVQANDNDRCQLLQQNIAIGPFLNNAGRISVGQTSVARCRTNPDEAVGRNVYQENIGMCRGNKISVDVGFQDANNNAAIERVDQIFSIVVGRDHFDLNGGDHTVVATHSFVPPTAAPFNLFTATNIEGIWNGPRGDSCSQICPQNNCFVVGVRYARNAVVTSRVRGYIDNLVIVDEVIPEITANDVSTMATSCSASMLVNYDTTAVDNCCATVTIEYDSGNGWSTTPSGSFTPGVYTVQVRATDNSGNQATGSFTVRVAEAPPLISCSNFAANTQTCWTELPAGTELATRDRACAGASSITYTPSLTQRFRNGITIVTASFTQPDAINGPGYEVSCTSEVQFTLCCQAENSDKKRSAPASLRKLAKF